MLDERTPEEIARNYPPRKSTMVRRCTMPIIGAPDAWLFDQVTADLLAFLNTPGLTRDDLFATFRDTAGAFVAPSLHNAGKGRFFRGPRAKAALRLRDAAPQSWLDVLRIDDIGPDSFYDMFLMMAVRWVHRFGACVPVFVAADGTPLDGVDVTLQSGPGIAAPVAMTVRHGIGFDAASGGVVAFPSIGEYVVAGPAASIRVEVPVATAFTRVGFAAGGALRVFHDPEIVALSVHPARDVYNARHWQGGVATFDRDGMPCGDCEQFAFVRQEDMEKAPVLSVPTDRERGSTVLHGLPPDRYVVAGHTGQGLIVTTVRDVAIDAASVREIGLDHGFDLTRLEVEPPRRAFLQGNVVQQRQQDTNWCGPFSLAHAFSYWAPLRYGPMGDNGQWLGEHVRDGWATWLHLLATYLTFGLAPMVASIFIDDPSPGTLQETMVLGARRYGFSSQGYGYGSLGKAEALAQLKRWIHCGVPVIVTIDEHMDEGDHLRSEHYKVLVGYDDDAQLRYLDDDGNEHTSTGAFYFLNSGLQGEYREDVDAIDAHLRETHDDYGRVPIGNDADSYTVFWKKWKTGGIPSLSHAVWCLPIYPVDFVKAYAPRPEED